MERLARLNARLATLSELREIIIALRSMAASAAREGEEALEAIRRYGKTIEQGLADTAAIYGLAPAPKETVEGPGLMCLIGSEHGFVGDLNRRLVEHAKGLGGDWQMLLVGQKLAGAAEEAKMGAVDIVPMTSHVASIPLAARRIADRAVAYDRVSVTLAVHESGEGLRDRGAADLADSARGVRRGVGSRRRCTIWSRRNCYGKSPQNICWPSLPTRFWRRLPASTRCGCGC